MNISSLFSRGLNLVIENRKLVVTIFVVNLCLALLLAVPFFVGLNAEVADALVRDQLSSGFDHGWWQEFNFERSDLPSTFRPGLSHGYAILFDNVELLLTGKLAQFGWYVFPVVLAFLFLAAFFNGGAIALFSDEKRQFSLQWFFSSSAYYFHHLATLAFTALLLFGICYKVIFPGIINGITGLAGADASQPVLWFLNLLGFIIVAILIFLITMIFDYAKVIIINEKKQSSWLCIALAAGFVFKHFFRAAGLYLLSSAVVLLLIVVGGGVLSVMPSNNLFLLIVLVLLQQLYILLKIGARMNFYANQVVLYQDVQAAQRPAKKHGKRKKR